MIRGKARTFVATGSERVAPARQARSPLGGWMRWIAGARSAGSAAAERPSSNLCARVRRLPALLDSSSLPNGIVELVVEDFDTHTRQLFDVHDGVVSLIDPGSAVPWASIAGTQAEWSSALGSERRVDALRLTGDQALAHCVIQAFPAQA